MGRRACALAALLAGAQASRLLRAGPAAAAGSAEHAGPPPVEVVVAAWDHAPTWEHKLLSRIRPPPRVRLYCGPSLNDTRCQRIADHGAEESTPSSRTSWRTTTGWLRSRSSRLSACTATSTIT
ncbi:unnamed protein product [Prorocentrum cordatum]|uniref:Uncharacterized protein n=1 Tax=Prorocentrum cordatum TaxID=2364126 RepID=A0ABN9UWE5_9DINO|nr:unnamed protein product [Polarella glacialis]